MSLTEIQKLQVKNLSMEWKERTALIAKGVDVGTLRFIELAKHSFYLESLFVYAQMVEHCLKMILQGHASKRQILKILGEPDLFADHNLRDIDDETLGKLINMLKNFTGENHFIKILKRLNDLRNEVAHDLFGGYNNICQVNQRAKEFIGKEISFLSREIILKSAQEVSDEILEIIVKSEALS